MGRKNCEWSVSSVGSVEGEAGSAMIPSTLNLKKIGKKKNKVDMFLVWSQTFDPPITSSGADSAKLGKQLEY